MQLNDEQSKYVKDNSDSLVIAAPGSGKTRSLAFKTVHILEELLDTKSYVAVLTYTNRASDEIYERVLNYREEVENLWIGTIHSFCLEWILKSFRNDIPELCHGFTVADEYTTSEILDVLKKKYQLNYYEEINTKLSVEGKPLEKNPLKFKLALEYHQELKQLGLIDYDLILFYCFKFLTNNINALKLVSNVFRWVLVDEYQDTQELQYQLIALLRKCNLNMRVSFVGDPNQAIFSGLGGVAYSKGSLESLMKIKFELFEFHGCYRSVQKIIDYYSSFQVQHINIKSMLDYNVGVISYDYEIHKNNLSNEIKKIVLAELHSGTKESDICIIAPQWELIEQFVIQLKTLLPEVRIDSPGSSPIYKNRENFWFGLARIFLTEPSPTNFRRRKKWAKDCIKFLDTFLQISDDHKNVITFLTNTNKTRSTSQIGTTYLSESFSSFCKTIEIDFLNSPILLEQYNKFFEGTFKRILKLKIDDSVSVFKSFFSDHEGLVVNTCHGIKGEEYKVVIAFSLLYGRVPHWKSIMDSSINEDVEAKKMLFVICSRAKEKLHLFSERGYFTQNGRTEYSRTALIPTYYQYD